MEQRKERVKQNIVGIAEQGQSVIDADKIKEEHIRKCLQKTQKYN